MLLLYIRDVPNHASIHAALLQKHLTIGYVRRIQYHAETTYFEVNYVQEQDVQEQNVQE